MYIRKHQNEMKHIRYHKIDDANYSSQRPQPKIIPMLKKIVRKKLKKKKKNIIIISRINLYIFFIIVITIQKKNINNSFITV